MARQPWTTEQFDFPILRVPSLRPPPLSEQEDIVYCLWTVSQYMENEYPDREVRMKTDAPSIDRIKGVIKTDELGWRPNQSDLTELSILTSNSFHFSLDSWDGEPPTNLVAIAEENLSVELPMIAYIDDLQLRRHIRGEGPMHPVVIVGTDDTKTAIADPWMGGIQEVDRSKLDDAWDPIEHQIVEVELTPSHKTESGSSQ